MSSPTRRSRCSRATSRRPPARSKDTEGNREVPSVLLDPISITKDNQGGHRQGFAEASDVCTGDYAAHVPARRASAS